MAFCLEFDTPQNASVLVRPLDRKFRGRFDARRAGCHTLLSDWPLPIPGERLEMTSADNVFVTEPLHSDENAATREAVEAKGYKIGPERQKLENYHLDSLLFYCQELVDSGKASLVSGEIPKPKGQPKRRFYSSEPVEPMDRLTSALEKQTAMLAKVLARLEASDK